MNRIKGLLLTGVMASTSLSAAAYDELRLNEAVLAQAAAQRDAAMKGTNAWTLLAELTTLAGPRLPGSKGDAVAVEWAQETLTNLGYDKVYTEAFQMEGWERISESASVLHGANEQKMAVTALGGSVATPKAGIKAEVVMIKDFEALQAVDPASVKGKIIFIENHMARGTTGLGYGRAGLARRSGPAEAGRKGALALVIRSIGTDDHRNPHTGVTNYGDAPRIPAAALSNPDADQLRRLFEMGEQPILELNLQTRSLGTITTHTVIGEVRGSSKPDENVLMGCHLDSWDLGTGAVDDGAGCAIVMEAGAMIAKLDMRPARTTKVILFGAEEQGLIGANAYVKAHKDSIGKTDVVGSESDAGAGNVIGYQVNLPEGTDNLAYSLAKVLNPIGVKAYPGVARGGSDMSALTGAGMYAISLNQDTSSYFDLHHTPDDTLDKVGKTDLDQNVAAYVSYGILLGNWPGSLEYKKVQD